MEHIDSAYWDVHTHRSEGDLSHAICSCEWKDWERGTYDMAPYLSLSIHPRHLSEDDFLNPHGWLVDNVSNTRVVAVGEVGVDKYAPCDMKAQLISFGVSIDRAKEENLPMIIHAVKATDEVLLMKKVADTTFPWIIHGFRGKQQLAKCYLKHGFCLSFGEKYQEETLRITPLDSLFLETDESEVPIEELYHRAAKVRRMAVEELREAVTQNVQRLFFRQ